MNKEPIMILGFGRSGTTWVSDIISKSIGGTILFEPMHPESLTLSRSKEYCYYAGDDPKMLSDLHDHFKAMHKGDDRNKWLLRNHIGANLESVSQAYIDSIWDNCTILGSKIIRGNFQIPWIYKNISKKIVFIRRHPCSVISSLLNRNRFWEEYGFPFHEKKFLSETLDNSKYAHLKLKELYPLYSSLEEDWEKMTFIWAVSHKIITHDLEQLNIPIFDYEDLYLNPYVTTKKMLDYLGHTDVTLHPSYIFTPSMLTLKTFHEFSDNTDYVGNAGFRIFWKNTLDLNQENRILTITEKVLMNQKYKILSE